jgi:xanthine dehydrogenase YagR molybdenum-binding subunit
MTSARIAYRGQPIAMVVADTLEVALQAAALIRATYSVEAFSPTIDSPGARTIAQAESPLPKPMFADTVVGDAPAAFEKSVVKVDAVFRSPTQHHNPIELISTVAEWQGDQLIIYEGTQTAGALRFGVARQLGIAPDRVHIVSPYIGGGFGQKGALQVQTGLVAFAARQLSRPVKMVVPRSILFHNTTYRPASVHRIRLGAEPTGKIVAALHDVDAQSSRHDLFPCEYTSLSARLYGIENFRGFQRIVQTDVQTPGFMRTPFEHQSCFAMECSIDELAYELRQDPVELRIANDTTIDPITRHPLSSRHVAECLRRGAKRFGWSARKLEPMSTRAEDGSYIGWGVAIGAFQCLAAPNIAKLKVTRDGAVTISVGGHEMGQGMRNVLAAAVARKLNVPASNVVAVLGDTRAVPQHLTGGSWGTATVVPAAEAACDELLIALAKLAPAATPEMTPAEILRSAQRQELEVTVRTKAAGQGDDAFEALNAGQPAVAGPEFPGFVAGSYVAHFVEVRVEPTTRRVRVTRVVSVVDCGRVISPRTARSQVLGGVVWGIGSALREISEVDPRYGGFLNTEIAEYLVPVNADVPPVEVEFIDEPDPKFTNIGAKGLGQVTMVGVAPAISNAIFHATGRRLRELPFRIEHLL